MINPGSGVVVLLPFSCVGDVVQVSAVTVARTLSTRPEATPPGPLPPHLAEIWTGSHSSLGADGCAALMYILHKYSHVFPALGDMQWARCLVYLYDVISFCTDVPKAMLCLTEVLECLSTFGLQLMFQIMCAFARDVPAAATCITDFHGVSPDVLLAYEPWGHVDHASVACG